MMKVSIIIPAYNSSKTMTTIIENLDIENSIISEVIIVDSSEDRDYHKIEAIGKSHWKISLIHLESKTIPAVARNIGAQKAKEELLVFLDSDAYPDTNWLNRIIEAYSEGYQVGGGSIDIPPFQIKNKIAMAQYYLQFNEFLPIKNDRRKIFVPSCNLFCNKKIFNIAGGFPTIRASEDVAFGHNVSKYKDLWFIPQAVVYHIFGTDWKRLSMNQELLGKYVAIYSHKKSQHSVLKKSIVLIFVFFIPLIKYNLLLTRVSRAGVKHLIRYLKATPVIFIGLLYWTKGYISGNFYGDADEI